MNYEPTLSTVPAIVLSAILVSILFWDIKRDVRRVISGRNVVLAGILAWFMLEAVMLSRQVLQYSQGAYNYGVMCVALAAVSFLLVYHKTGGCRLLDPMLNRFRRLDDPQMLWKVVLLCAIIGFAPILYFSGLQFVELIDGILGMRKTWGGLLARSRYGGMRDALLQLEFFIKGAGPFAVLLLLDRRTTIGQKVACFVIAGWPVLRAVGSGTRSQLVTAILPVLAILYFRADRRVQRGVVMAGLASAPIVYMLMAAIVVSRGTGTFSWEAAAKAKYVGNEMFQELLYITTEIPDNGEYIYGYSYFVQVINPIPRFVWNGKPTFDSGLHLARLKGEVDPRTGEPYLTRSPGLIGEMYMNFGLVGIVALSGLGGWLVRGWDRLPRRHGDSVPTLILYCMGLAVLFIMGRSFNMHMLYAILFLLVGFYLTTSFFDATGQRRSKPRAPNSSSPPQRMSGTRVFHRPSLGTASSDSQPPAGS